MKVKRDGDYFEKNEELEDVIAREMAKEARVIARLISVLVDKGVLELRDVETITDMNDRLEKAD